MIHVAALPGTPHQDLPIDGIAAQAAAEARVLVQAGCDGLMTAVTMAVRGAVEVPLGVQILAGANQHALAVAQSSGAAFVRVEGFVFAHVADEGLMETADAGSLLRYRRQIGAEDIAIWADVKKKHASHSITADVDLAETARAAEFFGADGLVVTGVATGRPTDAADVQTVAESTNLPVAIGSGLTPENLQPCWPHANVFIVGSFIKQDGLWSNPIDPRRLESFMNAARKLQD